MIVIVIVNWNAGEQLRNCIESVRAYHSGLVGKCIVVDNGSTDGSTDFLADAKDVELILTEKNLGYAAACNLGASHGSGQFILLLNPDACLLTDTLASSVRYMEDHAAAGVGILGVQLIGDDGQVQRTSACFPTVGAMRAKSIGATTLVKHWDYHMQDWDHAETRRVDHLIGAYFLVRRELFERHSGLDERYFLYLEDLDFSYRAALSGSSSVYLAEVQAYHKGGGTSEQVKAHRLFYSLRSRMLYAFKHFPKPAAISVSTATIALERLSRLGMLILRGRWREIGDLGRGYRMLWSWALSRLGGAAKHG
jgi:GT2 family glycosyltransferase